MAEKKVRKLKNKAQARLIGETIKMRLIIKNKTKISLKIIILNRSKRRRRKKKYKF